MNPGGIRADVIASNVSGGEAPGEVTYEELFLVQPFSNILIMMTMTGADFEQLHFMKHSPVAPPALDRVTYRLPQ